jgi:glutaredoxin
MSNYSELLKDPRWQKKRLEIMARDKWTCGICQDAKNTLNVHHLKYSKMPWDAPDGFLITLCEQCHQAEEAYKRDNPALRDLSKKAGILATVLMDACIATSYRLTVDKETYPELRRYITDNSEGIVNMLTNGKRTTVF